MYLDAVLVWASPARPAVGSPATSVPRPGAVPWWHRDPTQSSNMAMGNTL